MLNIPALGDIVINIYLFRKSIGRISIIYDDNVVKNMTELDKVTTLYEDLKKALYNSPAISIFLKYHNMYYLSALSDLLDQEFDNETKVNDVIQAASTYQYKLISEELAKKHIHLNVQKINQILVNTTLLEDDLLNKDPDIIQCYYNTVTMLQNLTYEKYPIESFKRFLIYNGIKVSKKDNTLCFTFLQPPLKEQKQFQCTTIYEFLNYISPLLLDHVSKELLSLIHHSSQVIKTIPYENFNYDVAIALKGYDLYPYLYSFEYIRLNFFLEDLYILLFYEEIEQFQ